MRDSSSPYDLPRGGLFGKTINDDDDDDDDDDDVDVFDEGDDRIDTR